MSDELDKFGCCGQDEPIKTDGGGCIPQPPEIRIIPDGTRKLAGMEREYRTGDGSEWLTREVYKQWSAQLGREIDPLRAWYLEMGHPPDPDVKEALAELQRY